MDFIFISFFFSGHIAQVWNVWKCLVWGLGASHHNETLRNRSLLLSIGKAWNDTSWVFLDSMVLQCNSVVKSHCKEGEKYDYFCVLTVSYALKALEAGFPHDLFLGASSWWLTWAPQQGASKHIEPGLLPQVWTLSLCFD